MLEAIHLVEEISGQMLRYSISPQARMGDHIWWISDVSKFMIYNRAISGINTRHPFSIFSTLIENNSLPSHIGITGHRFAIYFIDVDKSF